MSLPDVEVATGLDVYKKVAQLYSAMNEHWNVKYIERILQKDGDINIEIPKNGYSIWTDYNLLHFTFSRDNIELFKLLLDNDVDYTVKNRASRTVVHRAIQDECYKNNLLNDRFKNPYIDLVLSAQLKTENTSNPCSDYGISQFHAACMINNVDAVEFFLKNGASVEQIVNTNSPIFAGFTPLHLAARYSCVETIEILLQYGVNIHLKNSEGKTALNLLMESKMGKPTLEVVDANEKIIEILVRHDISVNKNFTDIDDFGLSNLHISCVLKDTSILESILEKVGDINHAVKISSLFCPGYTPLHFAANFSFNTVKLLVNRYADIDMKDANGVTPFDLCLQRYNAEEIHFILSSKDEWRNIVLSDNKTKLLDLVFAMQSTERLLNFIDNTEFNVNSVVPNDSPLWSGYTLLHLAIIFSERLESQQLNSEWIDDCQKIEECLNEGSKITTADAKGCTALHLAFYLQKHRTVELLLKHHWTTENPRDSNNLSHFHVACAAGDQDAVERFLCGDINVDERVNSSFEWKVMCQHNSVDKAKKFFICPGSTTLHMNVARENVIITEMLLDEDADIYAKDCNGFTPIHRVLTTDHSDTIGNLLLNIDGLKDCVGPGGLSYLHVACHLGNIGAIKKFVESGSDINASITYRSDNSNVKKDEEFLDPYGDLSKERLSFLSRYAGFTPLQFSMRRSNFEANCYLIQKGSDIFAKSPNACSPIHEIIKELSSYCEVIIPILMNNNAWRKRVKEEFGLTMLHIAGCAINPDLCMDLINQGQDVNAQVHVDSIVWAGYTPLHFAATKAWTNNNDENENLRKIFDLVLDSKADVTISNRDKDTALHLLGKMTDRPYADSFYADLLLKSIKDFSVNPTDERGISLFHIACMKNNVAIVKGYLNYGVGVNQPISYFSDKYSGCSPLHLAVGCQLKSSQDDSSKVETVDLLLQHNADVNTRDSSDNTPLHKAATCESSREEMLKLIISKMSDLNAENVLGETALEVLLKTGNAKWEEINYFLERGCSLNFYNSVTQEGYISRIFTNSKTKEEYALENSTMQNFINSQYITEIDSNSRTCLHNLVSMGYFYIYDQVQLIKQFVDRGCDINHQDVEGRTALHRATLFKNNRAVFALIKNGADINIIDNQGKTAFSYAFEEEFPGDVRSHQDYHDPEHVIKNIASHVYKMMLCKLNVSKLNRQLLASSSEKYPLWERVIDRWNYSKERAKKAKIGSTSMTLYDFLFKVDAEIAYPKMTSMERQEIDDFLENIGDYKCCAIDYLVKHKINQGYEMLRLINQAAVSSSVLAKQQLPENCCQIILQFLSIADMKNLIAATS